MTSLESVLAEHRYMSRNRADRTGCRGCTWQGVERPGTDAAWAEFAAHVADAIREFLRSDEIRERVGRAIWAENLDTAHTANMPDAEARTHFAQAALAAITEGDQS